MFTDQEVEAAIAAIMDRAQNRAVAVRAVLSMLHANLQQLVIPAGAKFLFAAGAPDVALGVEGDVYDNTTTGDRYQKQADGTWQFKYRARGADGRTPQKGVDYVDGYTPRKGTDYFDGRDGKSAYQIWLDHGNTGNEAAFLASLQGSAEKGADGTRYLAQTYDPTDTDGEDGDIWQTAVSLTTERRYQKVAGHWRKFYDNTGTTSGSGGSGGGSTPATNQKPSVSFSAVNTNAPTVGVAKDYLAVATDPDDVVAGVDLVQVQGVPASGNDPVVIGVLASDSASPYMLSWTPGVASTVYLAARATDSKGAIAYSSVLTVLVQASSGGGGTTPTKLDPPTGLMVVATNGTTTTSSWASRANATSYNLQRATDIDFTQNVSIVYTGASTSYVNSGLTTGTKYFYRVLAVGSAAYPSSDYSAAVSVTPVNPPSQKTFILFRGDSNTNGGEGTAAQPYFTSPNASFVSLVSQALGCTRDPADPAKWVGENFATYNAGVGGYTNANLAPGLADLVTQQWDKTKYPNCVVCYMAGTNDENNGITVSQAQGYVNTLKPQLDAIGAKFIISTAIEPSAHQGRPHGTWFMAFNPWLEANALGSIGAAGFVDFYTNNKINLLDYNGAIHGLVNTDYWSLQQYGGVGGTGNGGVPFDAFHWGDLGHAEYANQHLLPVIQQVTGQTTGTGNVTPAAPSVNANDAADTLAFSHALGTSELVISVNGAAFVPYAGPYQIGDVNLEAGYYRCKVKAAAGRNESPLATSPAFTVSVKDYTEVPYTDSRIIGNPAYNSAYIQSTSQDGRQFVSVGRDPLLWYRFTSTKGGRLRWPVSTAPSTEAHSLFGTGNPSAMIVTVDGVQQSQPYPVVNGQLVFDFRFTDGATHTIQWYPVDSGQNNLYKFEAYT